TADVMLALNTVRASSDSTRKSVRDLCFRIGRRFGETNQERMTCDAERKYGSMKGPRSKKATVRNHVCAWQPRAGVPNLADHAQCGHFPQRVPKEKASCAGGTRGRKVGARQVAVTSGRQSCGGC